MFIPLNFSFGIPRSWVQTRDHWTDIKSKAVNKDDDNHNETGNGPEKPLKPIERAILDLLERKDSNQLTGIEGGFDTCVSVMFCLIFELLRRIVFQFGKDLLYFL